MNPKSMYVRVFFFEAFDDSHTPPARVVASRYGRQRKWTERFVNIWLEDLGIESFEPGDAIDDTSVAHALAQKFPGYDWRLVARAGNEETWRGVAK
jgi:hypothetical protein